ncbi:uncharacterized protein LOC106658035 [Trichogramma pretiosum]|uniref:uncharacterized protein LOC106658035 n=1 Tax=Trichogramma pretiosum TaxID=7493 RepID=UPI0006C9BA71|nr:uncharacterized protein LOC106658035 [Trichogramma pretiosum]
MSVRELIERDSSVLDVNAVSGCASGLQATKIYESMDQNFFQRSFGSSLTPVIYGPKVEDNYLPSINFVPPCPPAMLSAPIRYFNEDLIGNPVKNQVANPVVNQQRSISVPAPAVHSVPVQTKKKKNKGKKNNKIKMSQAIQAEIKRNNSTSSSPVCQQATMIINAVGKKQRNRIQNSINMYKKRKNHQQHSVNINNANKKIKGNLEDNTSVKQEEKKICLQSNENANLENSCTEHCINTNEERQIHLENSVNVDNEQDSEQVQRNFLKMFVEIGRLRERLDYQEELLMEKFKQFTNSNSSNLL